MNLRFSFFTLLLVASLVIVVFFCGGPASAMTSFESSTEEVAVSLLDPVVPWEFWDDIINQDGGNRVLFGIQLLGPSPYSRNSELNFIPASNTKLFTTAAALAILGPGYRYKTEIEWTPVALSEPHRVRELTLIGFGDPSWGLGELGEGVTSRVDAIADLLVQAGIKEVRGAIRIVSGDPRWDRLRFPEGWEAEDYSACYAALAQSFNLDINCAKFVVTGINRGHWEDPSVPISVSVNLRSGSQTYLKVEAIDAPDVVSARFRIRGTWSRFMGAAEVYLPVHDTRTRVRNLLIQSLRAEGVKIVPQDFLDGIEKDDESEPMRVQLLSPPLSEIIKPFMKNSLNVIGDALFKTLGQVYGDPQLDLISAGQQVMRDFVSKIGTTTARNLGLEPRYGFFSSTISLWDGSGLSRSNQVTTNAVMALLRDVQAREYFFMLWDSLPIAGVDGTLAYRMRRTPAEGILRGKTGTLHGVYNLSGYVPRIESDGRVSEVVPFVILSRTDSSNNEEARAAQDRVGAALAKIVNDRGGLP